MNDILQSVLGSAVVVVLGVICYKTWAAARALQPMTPRDKALVTRPAELVPPIKKPGASGGPASPAIRQLEILDGAALEAKAPINGEASRVLALLDRLIAQDYPRHRLLAEVAMGAFLSPIAREGVDTREIYATFGSKRVDFLILDGDGSPRLAVEYHGSGHYIGDAIERDRVKRKALALAGVELVEVNVGDADDLWLDSCRKALRRPARAHLINPQRAGSLGLIPG